MIKNNNSNVTKHIYKLKIDKIQSFLIDEVNDSYSLFHHHTIRGGEGDAFFNAVKIADYKSLESELKKVCCGTYIRGGGDCNEE